MPATQTANTPAAPEEVWAILKENTIGMNEIRELQKENTIGVNEIRELQKENSIGVNELRELQKETDRQMKETDRQIKALNKQMGGLHNSFGEMAEHLVAPGVVERFNSLGYHFDGVADRGFKIIDEKRNLKAEIDILLENSNFIIAVEVKAGVRKGDIDHHIKRLEILREHRNKHKDPRKIRGAIAGAVFYSNIKEIAIAKGLYVLEQSGDTMKMDIPENFKPKEW